jgi:hypothetical protein
MTGGKSGMKQRSWKKRIDTWKKRYNECMILNTIIFLKIQK